MRNQPPCIPIRRSPRPIRNRLIPMRRSSSQPQPPAVPAAAAAAQAQQFQQAQPAYPPNYAQPQQYPPHFAPQQAAYPYPPAPPQPAFHAWQPQPVAFDRLRPPAAGARRTRPIRRAPRKRRPHRIRRPQPAYAPRAVLRCGAHARCRRSRRCARACANSAMPFATSPRTAPAAPIERRIPRRFRVYGTGRRNDGIAPSFFDENAAPKLNHAKGGQ